MTSRRRPTAAGCRPPGRHPFLLRLLRVRLRRAVPEARSAGGDRQRAARSGAGGGGGPAGDGRGAAGGAGGCASQGAQGVDGGEPSQPGRADLHRGRGAVRHARVPEGAGHRHRGADDHGGERGHLGRGAAGAGAGGPRDQGDAVVEHLHRGRHDERQRPWARPRRDADGGGGRALPPAAGGRERGGGEPHREPGALLAGDRRVRDVRRHPGRDAQGDEGRAVRAARGVDGLQGRSRRTSPTA